MFKFRPWTAALVFVFLMVGQHYYQAANNPCYKVMRLHVVANSDLPADQAVKLKVRDEILKFMGPKLKKAGDAEEAQAITLAYLPVLEQRARQIVRASGKDYPVKAYIGNYTFPTRFYGEQVFPPGEYLALRVVLGRGSGRNWWCVLFPPLCWNQTGNSSAKEEAPEIKLKCVELLKQQSRLKKARFGLGAQIKG